MDGFGVADRGDRDIDAGTWFGESGDIGGDHHGGDIVRFDGFWRDFDAEALEGIGDTLDSVGEFAVAFSCEADD